MNTPAGNRPDSLWAITSYFNPQNYRRRLANYHAFRQRLQLPLATVELSFDGQFDLRPEDADILVQRHGGDVMWQKERLLNLALEALPAACSKVIWADCDLIAGSADWAERTRQSLDQFPLVQPFSRLAYLAPDAHVSADCVPSAVDFWARSAVAMIQVGEPVARCLTHQGPYEQSYPRGIVWAARRSLLARHGFYDAGIVGNGNLAIACAGYGCFDVVIRNQGMNERQLAHYLAWAEPFFRDVQGAVGAVECSLFHLWHGTIANRRYRERLQGLRPFRFDPYRDIALAESGVWRWNSDKPLLHQYVKNYFASRKEDG